MTPYPYNNRRQEPNPLQIFRFEQLWGGNGARLFYNEVPQLSWLKQKGHLVESNDEKEKERALFSFTHANQDKELLFGMDTSTPEGQAAFKAEYEALAEMAPEIIKKDEMVFPHQLPQRVSTEPHFRRVWQHYREHTFKAALDKAVASGAVSEGDAAAFDNFVGMTGTSSWNLFILISQGKLTYLESDEGYQATTRVLKGLGMDTITWTDTTAAPAEEQFWAQFDDVFQLSETEMRKSLPDFVIDDGNRAKVEALLSGAEETTRALQ